jgi:uncharacterized protein YidB (DUF937 family)
MNMMNLAKGLLAQKLGGNSGAIDDVLGRLLGGSAGAEGGLDLGNLVSGLKEKGLGDVADSWLGDGENAEISADQLKEVIGEEKITEAAAQLGTDEGSLLDGLKDALPQIIDKSSSGGSLLDSLGGIGALGGMAKKLF